MVVRTLTINLGVVVDRFWVGRISVSVIFSGMHLDARRVTESQERCATPPSQGSSSGKLLPVRCAQGPGGTRGGIRCRRQAFCTKVDSNF